MCIDLGRVRSIRLDDERRDCTRESRLPALDSYRRSQHRPREERNGCEEEGASTDDRRRAPRTSSLSTLGGAASSRYVPSRHVAYGTFNEDGGIDSPGRQLSFYTVGACGRTSKAREDGKDARCQ